MKQMSRYDLAIKEKEEESYLFKVLCDSKWGIFDATKETEVIPAVYDDVKIIDNDYFALCVDDAWGMCDYYRNTLLPRTYKSIQHFNEIFIALETKDNSFLYYNKLTKTVESNWYNITSKNSNYAIIQKDLYYGLLSYVSKGNVLLDIKYEVILPIDGFNYFVCKNSKWYIFNATDMNFKKIDYDMVVDLNNPNYFIVINNNLMGLLDKNLKLVIPIEYDRIEYLCNNCFKVVTNNRCGVFKISDQLIIKCKYLEITKLNKIYLDVTDEYHKHAVFDTYGVQHTEFLYDALEHLKSNILFHIRLDFYHKHVVGIINPNGKILIPPLYDNIKALDNFYIVSLDNKLGIYNKDFKPVSKVIYDDISNVGTNKYGLNFANVILNGIKGSRYW